MFDLLATYFSEPIPNCVKSVELNCLVKSIFHSVEDVGSTKTYLGKIKTLIDRLLVKPLEAEVTSTTAESRLSELKQDEGFVIIDDITGYECPDLSSQESSPSCLAVEIGKWCQDDNNTKRFIEIYDRSIEKYNSSSWFINRQLYPRKFDEFKHQFMEAKNKIRALHEFLTESNRGWEASSFNTIFFTSLIKVVVKDYHKSLNTMRQIKDNLPRLLASSEFNIGKQAYDPAFLREEVLVHISAILVHYDPKPLVSSRQVPFL